jgi:hypothetical protein
MSLLTRLQGGQIEFSGDGRQRLFAIDAARFAHIAHLCADGEDAIVCAAESAADTADVSAGRRGNYRAWRIGAAGERCLTREYTCAALPLPGSDGEALAYSNGTHLVLLEGGQRRAFKTGAFSWGPRSLSVDASGQRVAMTQWRGDDRKLFWLDRGSGDSAMSAFTYYSYQLIDGACCICTARAIKRYDFATAALSTLTDARFMARLLDALGIAAAARVDLGSDWRGLGRLGERLVATVHLRRTTDWQPLAHALIAFDPQRAAASIKLIDGALGVWGATSMVADGVSLQAQLERHEDGQLVETRMLGLGPHAQALQAGWSLVGDERHAQADFSFLPG